MSGLMWRKTGRFMQRGMSGAVTFFEIERKDGDQFLLSGSAPGASVFPRQFQNEAKAKKYAERQFNEWLKLAGLCPVMDAALAVYLSKRPVLMAPELLRMAKAVTKPMTANKLAKIAGVSPEAIEAHYAMRPLKKKKR